MRFFFKLFAVAFISLGATSYLGYIMTGRTPWDSAKIPSFDAGLPEIDVVDKVSKLTPVKQEKQKVYKWRTADGDWNFSSAPPAEDVAYEVMMVDPNINLFDAPPPPPPDEEESESFASAGSGGSRTSPRGTTTGGASGFSTGASDEDTPPLYSPRGVRKLVDDARNTQDMLNDRVQKQREILDKL